jgi:hypothetical protein
MKPEYRAAVQRGEKDGENPFSLLFWIRKTERGEKGGSVSRSPTQFLLSISRSLTLSFSLPVSLGKERVKGRTGKKEKREERRKKKEEESCCGLEEKHRRWRVSAFFFFFWVCYCLSLSFRPRQKNERRVPASAMGEKQRNKE